MKRCRLTASLVLTFGCGKVEENFGNERYHVLHVIETRIENPFSRDGFAVLSSIVIEILCYGCFELLILL